MAALFFCGARRFPQRVTRHEFPALVIKRLRCQGRGLIAKVRFTEQVIADAELLQTILGLEEFILMGDAADDDRRDGVWIAEPDSHFMSGMSRLAELIFDRKVLPDQHVKMGLLCFLRHGFFSSDSTLSSWIVNFFTSYPDSPIRKGIRNHSSLHTRLSRASAS